MLLELHTHTHHSLGEKVHYDGISKPEAMVRRASRLGIGALNISDHDTQKGLAEARKAGKKYGVLIIPGEEISSKQGHIVAVGISEAIPPGMDYRETIDRIHELGGVAIASHPFDITKHGLHERAKKCDAVESFSAINLDRFSNRTCRAFAKKHGLHQVAGSDAHCPEMLGHGVNWTDAEGIDGIVKAIRGGRTEISIARYQPMSNILSWNVGKLQMSYDQVLSYVNDNYGWFRRAAGTNLLKLVNHSPGKVDWLIKFFGYTGLAVAFGVGAKQFVGNKF